MFIWTCLLYILRNELISFSSYSNIHVFHSFLPSLQIPARHVIYLVANSPITCNKWPEMNQIRLAHINTHLQTRPHFWSAIKKTSKALHFAGITPFFSCAWVLLLTPVSDESSILGHFLLEKWSDEYMFVCLVLFSLVCRRHFVQSFIWPQGRISQHVDAFS